MKSDLVAGKSDLIAGKRDLVAGRSESTSEDRKSHSTKLSN